MKISAVDPSIVPAVSDIKQGEVTFPLPKSSPEQGKQERVDPDELKNALSKMNQTAEIYLHDVKFVINNEAHRVTVQVLDKETHAVITEVPPKQILEMVMAFENMVGLLVDKKA